MQTSLLTQQLKSIINTSEYGMDMDTSVDAELLGTVFESALVHFLYTQDEVKQIAFLGWVEEHAHDQTFLTDVCQAYPTLYTALENEIKSVTQFTAASR